MAPFPGPAAMNFSVIGFSRFAFLPLAALGGLLAASALASDRPASGAERWTLRPVRSPEPAPALVPVLRGVKAIPLSDLPGERRSVRVIYQGYGPVAAASER
ncbi:hypothetical protein [Methylorubrum salsuginis]|uniref:Uncharacterized protein n=1 Tax=Methylorubrum salsuginis TaxID=414703 RepID=A0A1I3YGJ9_9HYPH|nr:hypothetical protein [Methylorubrum salsuginis]SFK30915.1 hypothetical protein SAMN04488125_101198 [Methylorubrum salsuginis]